MSALTPRPGKATKLLYYADMLSLAKLHDGLAGESILRGEHAAHDFHECRAFGLRKLAAVARATVTPEVVN